jgi:hypothetical protein
MHTGFSCRGREFSQLPGREAYECTKPALWSSSRSRQAHRNFNLEIAQQAGHNSVYDPAPDRCAEVRGSVSCT